MGVLAMLMPALLAAFLVAIMYVVVGVLCIFIFGLMIKGATTIPSVIFAFVLGARFDNIILNIIAVGLSFVLTKKLMEYTRIRNAIVIFVAMVAATFAFAMPKTLVFMLDLEIPSLIWILLCFIFAGAVATFVLVSDGTKWNEKHVLFERIVSSFLYMAGLGFVVSMFGFKGVEETTFVKICEIAFIVLSFVGPYIADVKLTKDWVHIKQKLLQYPLVRTIVIITKKALERLRLGV